MRAVRRTAPPRGAGGTPSGAAFAAALRALLAAAGGALRGCTASASTATLAAPRPTPPTAGAEQHAAALGRFFRAVVAPEAIIRPEAADVNARNVARNVARNERRNAECAARAAAAAAEEEG